MAQAQQAPSRGKAVVVGAGIVGLATACRLAESGWHVTVVERNGAPAEGASHANAGQLLFDHVGAMGSPALLRSLPSLLRDDSQGVAAGGLTRPANWPWALRFALNCTPGAWRRNTAAMLTLAAQSRAALHRFLERHPIAFEWRRPGRLVLYPDRQGLEVAARAAAFEAGFGGRHSVIGAEDCLRLEPALKGGARRRMGAIHLPEAEVGDCRALCVGLARALAGPLGGRVLYGTDVRGLVRHDNEVSALAAAEGEIAGDLFVLASGRTVGRLLPRAFAGKKPVIGVKGLSLTYPIGSAPPEMSIADAGGRFVVARIGAQLRVTGFTQFTDDLSIAPAEVAQLREKAHGLMPGAARYDAHPEVWAGLRPQTPDDLPMIGRAGMKNLYVNAGHGSLGFTFAFGAAERLLAAVAT